MNGTPGLLQFLGSGPKRRYAELWSERSHSVEARACVPCCRRSRAAIPPLPSPPHVERRRLARNEHEVGVCQSLDVLAPPAACGVDHDLVHTRPPVSLWSCRFPCWCLRKRNVQNLLAADRQRCLRIRVEERGFLVLRPIGREADGEGGFSAAALGRIQGDDHFPTSAGGRGAAVFRGSGAKRKPLDRNAAG